MFKLVCLSILKFIKCYFEQITHKKRLPIGSLFLLYYYLNGYAIINTGCSSIALNVFKNSAPITPSITLWSHDKVTFIVCPTTICPFLTTGFSTIAPTERIAEFGALIIDVTLACDHRTVDGATGAAFLKTFRSFIENPVTMLA